jgi:hypothetical protein
MKFTLSLSALAAFAATVMAQTEGFDSVTQPEPNAKLPAGETFEVVWSAPKDYAEGTVSLHLIGGETQDTQQPLADIAAGIPNSAEKYSWAVDAALGDAKFYGLVIKYESNPDIFQYSNPFHIVKAEGADSAADQTTTISKSYGEKTVTLSACDCEETTSSTSTITPPVISTPTPTPSPAENTTSTYVKPTTIKTKPVPIQTTEIEVVQPEPTTPATVPESGANARFGASSVALVGAFVVAAFAL